MARGRGGGGRATVLSGRVARPRCDLRGPSIRRSRLPPRMRVSGGGPVRYSARRAVTGSTFVARRAGNQVAASPAPRSAAATVPYVTGSKAPTP